MLELFIEICSRNEDGTGNGRLERIILPDGTIIVRDENDDIDFLLVEPYVEEDAVIVFSHGHREYVKIRQVEEDKIFFS